MVAQSTLAATVPARHRYKHLPWRFIFTYHRGLAYKRYCRLVHVLQYSIYDVILLVDTGRPPAMAFGPPIVVFLLLDVLCYADRPYQTMFWAQALLSGTAHGLTYTGLMIQRASRWRFCTSVCSESLYVRTNGVVVGRELKPDFNDELSVVWNIQARGLRRKCKH